MCVCLYVCICLLLDVSRWIISEQMNVICFSCIYVSFFPYNQARIWDLRYLDSKHNLAELPHPRVVNSAYFSPITGNKILTTCQDNRLRIYDCIFSNLAEPSREIVHSHDFNRYLTGFRAEWDPKVLYRNIKQIFLNGSPCYIILVPLMIHS